MICEISCVDIRVGRSFKISCVGRSFVHQSFEISRVGRHFKISCVGMSFEICCDGRPSDY